MSKLRVAVVGVGHIGRHHARILAELPDVELVAVVDVNKEAARNAAQSCRCQALDDPAELHGSVDAVTIAVPTLHHFETAWPFLKRGVAALIEKPLAFSIDEARILVETARKRNAVLQVGHVERFNPAWQEAFASDPFRPLVVEARRFSSYPFRSLDVSVVFDVMIHDLDLVLAAVGSTVTRIEAQGIRVYSPTADRACVRLDFANGAWAWISASRVDPESTREIRLWNDENLLRIDLLKRTSSSYRLPERQRGDDRIPAAPLASEERQRLLDEMFKGEQREHDRAVEPLRAELTEFVQSVRERRDPLVAGEAGLAAVQVARRIDDLLDAPAILRKSA